MTKLEELKAAREDAWVAAHDAEAAAFAWCTACDVIAAYKAKLKKIQEENPMTKLEKLKAAYNAARDAYEADLDAEYACDAYRDAAACAAARDAGDASWDARNAALAAYKAELKKTQEENSDD
jgi:hypothetical protein